MLLLSSLLLLSSYLLLVLSLLVFLSSLLSLMMLALLKKRVLFRIMDHNMTSGWQCDREIRRMAIPHTTSHRYCQSGFSSRKLESSRKLGRPRQMVIKEAVSTWSLKQLFFYFEEKRAG